MLKPLELAAAKFHKDVTVSVSSESTKISLLILGKDLRTAHRMASMLREDGFDAEVCSNAAAAMERLGQAPRPDVVLVEIAMSLPDGREVARCARAQQPRVPIIVFTNYPNYVDCDEFGEPAAIVLTKPVDYSTLRETLDQFSRV